MKKERLFIFICSVLVFFSSIVLISAQNPIDKSGFEGEAGKILNTTHQLKEITQNGRLDYLGQQWQDFLLNHIALGKVDSSLKKGNTIFFVLFGQDYNFSYRFFLIILFWLAFFLTFEEIFLYFSTFNKSYSYIFGLILAVICAHLGLIKGFTELFYNTVFGLLGGVLLPKYLSMGIFKWMWELVFLTVVVCYIIFSGQLVKLAKKMWEKIKERRRLRKLEKEADATKRGGQRFIETLAEGAD